MVNVPSLGTWAETRFLHTRASKGNYSAEIVGNLDKVFANPLLGINSHVGDSKLCD